MTNDNTQKAIFTIGHSTHPIDGFIDILQSFSISVLADIRNFPGSKRYPHFNKESLQKSLEENNIRYVHFKDLGGRRKPVDNSVNTRWRNSAFRGYADYMSSDSFAKAISELEELASGQRLVYMCAEAVWWSCHRSLISDYLKIRGWAVWNIMAFGKASEHPFTSAARIVEGELRYDDPELFDNGQAQK
jgi:uncharacterized protein (DUF488 family)